LQKKLFLKIPGKIKTVTLKTNQANLTYPNYNASYSSSVSQPVRRRLLRGLPPNVLQTSYFNTLMSC
jgi:hypothetical protein